MNLRSALGTLKETALSGIARYSPGTAAYVDWLNPAHHQSFGGPMNGQPGRQALARALVQAVKLEGVIETGTLRGTTTEFLWHITGVPVWTVEADPRYAAFAARRFRNIPDVTAYTGDSRVYLPKLAEDPSVPRQRVLFYLDAHWQAELPLRDELLTVLKSWQEPIVMIDDFEVAGDPGYGFDDYGPGQRLTLSYLPQTEMAGFVALVPTLPSAEEGGLRRGCVVVASDQVARELLAQGVALRWASPTATRLAAGKGRA